MKNTIGTCSICGGAVTAPLVWMGVIPPTPTCDGCGARAASHGPVIPMQPTPQRHPVIKTGTGTGDYYFDPDGWRS